MTNYSSVPPACNDTIKKTLGNRSKEAPTWIGGHSQDLKPQHIPGYSGHVPGINSENMFSKGFGSTTADAIERKPLEQENRFKTSYAGDFEESKFRRLHEPTERARLEKKDQSEYNEYFGYKGGEPQPT